MKLNFVIVPNLIVFFLQIHASKAWEAETSTHNYEFANGMGLNNVYFLLPSVKLLFLQTYLQV